MQKTSGSKFNTNQLFAWLSVLILVVLVLAFIFRAPLATNTKKTTSTTSKTTTVSDISNWRTFTSTLFKYSIKFPNEWPNYSKVIDVNPGQETEALFINRSENQDATKINQPHIEIYGNFSGDWCNNSSCKTEDVTIGGISGKKWSYTKDLVGDDVYYFESKKLTIFVSKREQADIADKIIQSLQFN